MHITPQPGQRYCSNRPIQAKLWWQRETLAILDDYTECDDCELPPAEEFTISRVFSDQRNSVIVKLAHEHALQKRLFPKGRGNRLLWFRVSTPYVVEISLQELAASCDSPLDDG